MNYFYELLNSEQGHLVNVFIHSVDTNEMHWHDEMEILLVLEGSINIRIGNKVHLLHEDDLILINTREIHNIIKTQENNILLEIQIKQDYFISYYPEFKKMIFDCKSFLYGLEEQERFDIIRRYLAKIVLETNKKEKGYQLTIGSNIHLLCAHIIKNFNYTLADNKKVEDVNKDIARLQNIVDYINDNFESRITLKEIADREQLNAYYLSHFFKDKMGMSFQQYMHNIRVDKATQLLLNSNDTITQISYASGFPSTKSFYKLFKDRNNCTPTEFREKNRNSRKILGHRGVGNKRGMAYPIEDKERAFAKLFSYLAVEDIRAQHKFIEAKKDGEPYVPYWKNPTAFSMIPKELMGDWGTLFQEMQEKIGFKYVKFPGIFSDAMMIRKLDGKGNLIYNWSHADEVFNFLKKASLKPFIDLGFMPSEFRVFNKTMFWWDTEISGPPDIKLWSNLVTEFITHCINKYGLAEVETWYFGVWDESDLEDVIWIEGKEEYLEFCKQTIGAIKSVSDNLKIGNPEVVAHQTFEVVRGFKSI